ncbi:hypothetical protein CBS76997_10189 [Aspergillus niger]|nr:hypothetical protein CBS13152_10171 [Aspergillus niger]KAI2878457.1 hypothetical protein CBS11852_10208 [Aspergillus niger]KAI2956427.1 hypothetical protein CBS147323_9262 [Aspergillus niger]KAI3036229.1 hypothetical protein CBS76997_10189 [Aspergillus niger]
MVLFTNSTSKIFQASRRGALGQRRFKASDILAPGEFGTIFLHDLVKNRPESILNEVITLVVFDLKGACNGVNGNILSRQLKAKGFPTMLRTWVVRFMQGRSASISFDDFESPMSPLENAGLVQGSPLSPILFIFFNSNLVDRPVDCHGGASAFIDDYFRWRAGKSAEENLKKLQEEDIFRTEQWAKQTGSCFAAEKAELIRSTRKKHEQN